MSEQENLEIARLAMERWNSGDLDGVLDLYAEEAAMHPAADWPEQASSHGRDGIRENMEQWRSVWESSDIEVESLESYGDRGGREGRVAHPGSRERAGRTLGIQHRSCAAGWEDRLA
jgi:ketosteroid isomerase-like protein